MEENKLLRGALYVVGTPIGNLSDFSPRAAETLAAVDFIAAEDTRVTMKLLNHFGIKKPLVSYYEHNKAEKGGRIVDRILAGETCAIVSDAGMPAISDPGEDLVALCAEHDVPVLVVPGPSAVISALAVSGLPTGRFTFEGFLSVNKKSRKDHLESVKNEVRTMVFGDRRIAIVREITKIHEECVRTTLYKAAEYYEQNAPKGEFVLVIEGAKAEEQKEMTLEDAVEAAKKAMENGSSASDAAKEAAKLSGFKKGEIYKALMN